MKEVVFTQEEREQLNQNVDCIVDWIQEHMKIYLQPGERIEAPFEFEKEKLLMSVENKNGELNVKVKIFLELVNLSKQRLYPNIAYSLCDEWQSIKNSLVSQGGELIQMHESVYDFNV